MRDDLGRRSSGSNEVDEKMIIGLDEAPAADNRPLAHLHATLEDLARSDRALRDGIEPLDDERAVVVRAPSGVHVWLVEFSGGRPGVTLLAPPGLPDPDDVIDEIVRLLGLSPSVVAWRVTQ